MDNADAGPSSRPLSLDEYKRYGRQMIQPEWGLPGQLKLKRAKIAVVGAGGLGCPVLQYLVGAGVGTIKIIDHDTVDVSNLHRQILHPTERVGSNKAESAAIALKALNPHVNLVAVQEAITPSNAIALLAESDLVVDCTDRPLTRYLLSDASVMLDIPLVSGAAISTSGQWATYGGAPKGKRRACYRCMWPAVVGDGGGKCSEVGVWGSITGMVGAAMAAEALREIMGNGDAQPMIQMLRLGATPLIRSIKLRPPSEQCIACGPNKTITSLESYDYEGFCSGVHVNENSNTTVNRISPKAFQKLCSDRERNITIIDTRPPVEFGICSIPSSHNIPLNKILSSPSSVDSLQSDNMVFVCRQGNDSLVAAERVQKVLMKEGRTVQISDLKGGLIAWSRDVDPEFPIY